jgi:protein-disulfide isomerase
MTAVLWTLMLGAQLAVAQPQAPPAPRSEQVEVVLFSDFQCPFCARFAAVFRELQAAQIDGVTTTVSFRHFPLVMHPKAQLAHQAAAAAAEQGRFWEMHDLLFANQQRVQRDDLFGYAAKLGLDLDRFRADLDSDRIKQIIDADKADGDTRGIDGTPTFYVNGKAYVGARSFDQLKQIVAGEPRRTRALAEITDTVVSKGPAGAAVTVELFADLQSPMSRPAFSVLNELMHRYPSAVRLRFRNFPLPFHAQAGLAHEAAMIAARDGRFWEFATAALDQQDALREPDLIALAGRLGLDETTFAETLRQHRYAPRVDADLQDGHTRGLRGSPAIFVNDKRIDGVPSLQTLTECVEAALTTQQTRQAKKP